MTDTLKKVSQNSLKRRMALSIAGARGGVGLLSNRASGLFMSPDKQKAHYDKALSREAKRFVRELGKLKGAYVKIGQMLALYGDHLLPEPVTEALHELEDQTMMLDWSVMAPVIDAQLGQARENFDIDSEAIAAASLAQVYRADYMPTGEKKCLKVQYPDIASTIDSDFNSVMQMLVLTKWIKQGANIEQWMEQVKQVLDNEVNYIYEQSMTEQVRQYLIDDNRYIVPAVATQYSTPTLLVMDYVEGYDVSDPHVQALSLERRNKLAKAMLEIFFKEIFEWNLVQTDPNFGNYRIQIQESTDADKLVLLDFGATRKFPKPFIQALQQTIIAAYKRDIPGIIDGAIGLGCLSDKDNDEVKESFAQFCCYILEPLHQELTGVPEGVFNEAGQYRWKESKLLKRAGKQAAKSVFIKGFSIPPNEFGLLIKKLTGVFTFMSAIGAEFNAHHLLEKYVDS